MNYNPHTPFSEQDYHLVKTSVKKDSNQKELLRYLTNVLPNPTDIVSLDNAQDTVKSVKVQLANKNLIPYPYAETRSTINGITVTYGEDGSIIFNGTAVANVYFKVFDRLKFPAGQYYLSGTPAEGGVGVAFLYFFETDNPNKTYNAYTTNGVACSLSDTEYSGRIYIANGQTIENLVFKPQLELGTTATAYTPYISDFSTVKVTGCGKNLIQTNIIEVTSPNAVNKLIWQGNISGKLSFSLDNSKYINSSTPGAANFEFVFGDGTSKYLAANVQYIYLNTFSPLKEIHFLNWGQGTGVLKNIQLEIGSLETDYEPYQGQTYTPTATGEATGITVLTPTTNIINDKGLLFTKVTGDDFNYIN